MSKIKTRRDFLKNTAYMTAGSFFLSEFVKANPTAKVKNIGIQLYTVRKEMTADATGTLKQLAKIGFKELESARSEKGNYYGLSAKEIKKITKDLGMNLRSGHIHVDKDLQKSLDEAAESGQEYIISAVLPVPGQTIENYQQSADLFSKTGEDCKKMNIKFGYHNHNTEFQKVGDKVLYDVLLERTDPKLVHMEMDLGWVIAAGYDPIEYFNKYPGRFPLWHLKDMSKTTKSSVEFGKGDVNILQLLQNAKKSGMKNFFLEQEEYSVSALESAQYDYDYLMKLSV
jgi:sugar phosphate isomerase/epimerase